jgi:hypothetical protein
MVNKPRAHSVLWSRTDKACIRVIFFDQLSISFVARGAAVSILFDHFWLTRTFDHSDILITTNQEGIQDPAMAFMALLINRFVDLTDLTDMTDRTDLTDLTDLTH